MLESILSERGKGWVEKGGESRDGIGRIGEGTGQEEKGGREGEQELKGEGIEREERKGKGLGGEGRGEQGKE